MSNNETMAIIGVILLASLLSLAYVLSGGQAPLSVTSPSIITGATGVTPGTIFTYRSYYVVDKAKLDTALASVTVAANEKKIFNGNYQIQLKDPTGKVLDSGWYQFTVWKYNYPAAGGIGTGYSALLQDDRRSFKVTDVGGKWTTVDEATIYVNSVKYDITDRSKPNLYFTVSATAPGQECVPNSPQYCEGNSYTNQYFIKGCTADGKKTTVQACSGGDVCMTVYTTASGNALLSSGDFTRTMCSGTCTAGTIRCSGLYEYQQCMANALGAKFWGNTITLSAKSGNYVLQCVNDKQVWTPTQPAPIACTMDVQKCSDGSTVGRNSNNGCNFYPCPDSSNPTPPKPPAGCSPVLLPSEVRNAALPIDPACLAGTGVCKSADQIYADFIAKWGTEEAYCASAEANKVLAIQTDAAGCKQCIVKQPDLIPTLPPAVPTTPGVPNDGGAGSGAGTGGAGNGGTGAGNGAGAGIPIPGLPDQGDNTILYIIGGVFIAIIGLIIYFMVKKD